MKIIIDNDVQKEHFIALFHLLKNCTDIVTILFEENNLHIQGMDKSHICLFDINISNKWLTEYTKNNNDVESITINGGVFYNIISIAGHNYSININHTPDEADSLCIDLITKEPSKKDFNKFFKIPLIECENELLGIPTTDYDAEFSISSKKIHEITSQMLLFGNDINIKCTEDTIDLIATGITGEMLVNIPIDDLTEYGIVEDSVINLKFSLTYINKMCLTTKLSNEIDFSISNEYPMRIKYELGFDSNVLFFIAPKVADD